MINIFFFTLGFAACLAFCLRRQVEQRIAFDAACGQIDALRDRKKRYRETLASVRSSAESLLKKFDVGDVALPPAPAETSGRFYVIRSQIHFANNAQVAPGPPRRRRSRFFRRGR